MAELNLLQKIVVWALPVIFAITLHEVAHGWVAKLFGDRTAEMMGRLTLNPIKHIDLVGTILVPLVMLAISPFVFGWAKPVPVTWENLRQPRRDMALVAAAGPAANLLMLLFWAIAMKLALTLEPVVGSGTAEFFFLMGLAGVVINVVLMVLNLLPIPPLDGSRVVSSFLSGPWAYRYSLLEPYGLIIIVILLFTGVLTQILGPAVMGAQQLVFAWLFG